MNYTISDVGEGACWISAKIDGKSELEELIQKLIEYRDKRYPQQKEATNE